MDSIILAKDFDVSKLSYSDVRMLDNGGKVVFVAYNKAPLIVQTPELSCPFGMKDWENNKKYALDLSFKGKDSRPSVQSFYDMMEKIDDKLIDDGLVNAGTWFKGKKLGSREVVEALYTPIVKHAKDKNTGEITDKYPSTFKVNVPYKGDRFVCEFYDAQRAQVDLSAIPDLTSFTKGSKVTAIIQMTGLWLAGGKYGCSWKVLQMKIVPNQKLSGYAFRDAEEEPVDALDEYKPEEHEDPKDIMAAAEKKAESDGDEEVVSDSDEEDELEVKKPVTKRVVMKRK